MPTKIQIVTPIDVTIGEAVIEERPHYPTQSSIPQSNNYWGSPNSMGAYHGIEALVRNAGFVKGSVIILKNTAMPRYEMLMAKNWGVVIDTYKFRQAQHNTFKPIKVRWLIDGNEEFYEQHELILLIRAPETSVLNNLINLELSKVC